MRQRKGKRYKKKKRKKNLIDQWYLSKDFELLHQKIMKQNKKRQSLEKFHVRLFLIFPSS